MKPRPLRLLTRAQWRLFLPILVASGFLLANSAYLVLAGHLGGVGDSPDLLPLSYQWMLLAHVGVGILLIVPVLYFAFWHLGRSMKKRNRGTLPTGVALLIASVFLATTGLFILTAANSEQNQWAFIGHQVAAALLPLLYALHRVLSRDPPTGAAFAKGMAGTLIALGLMYGLHAIEVSDRAEAPPAAVQAAVPDVWRDPPIDDPFVPFVHQGEVSPDSPFWPSPATTSTGGPLPARIIHHDDFPDKEAFLKETRERGFAPNYYLGAQTCERCHPDIVAQWAVSAHRFASFNNPFYKKAVELTRETLGRKESQFCGGCHDPAIMLAGNFEKDIDPSTLEAQAALTCLACHAIDKIHNVTGNGNYNIQDEKPSPYIGFDAKGGLARFLSDYVVKSKPTVHKRRMLKPFFRESIFCASCHKVSLDAHINGYRWLRGQNEYDSWHNSGVAHNNPMTWYEPAESQTCQDCHMPLEEAVLGDVSASDGKVRSHRFLSVNTALPAIRGDHETLKGIKAVRRNSLRVDVFALHREDGATVMALDKGGVTVKPGETIQIDVVVRNRGVGHTFPGGTNDSNQGWIDFRVLTGDREIYRSGRVDERRFVDPATHFYQAVMVDKEGNRISRRNAPDIRGIIYSNVIPPSGSDIARYRFRVPDEGVTGPLRIEASVRWRKFNRTYTEFVYEGKEVPDLPIDELARDAVTIPVGGATPPAAAPGADEWTRFNDYGVGLFLDGDTRGALAAFTAIEKLVPQRPDGWRNRARVLMKDGNLVAAEAMLRKASDADPHDPKTTFFWGRLLEESGRLEKAVEAYRQALQHYPESRDTWSRLGQTFWRMGRHRECIEAYIEVLRMDPENANAHHKRSLAYKALAGAEQDPRKRAAYEFACREAERAYLKYKLDDKAQEWTREYRLKNPDDNRMSQMIVIHELKQ